MLPATKDISIYHGDTFVLMVRLREKTVDGLAGDPVDLTGATAKAQIRADYVTSTVTTEMSCTFPTGQPGVILVKIPASGTTAINTGVWDLQVTFPDGDVHTYLRGNVTSQQEVTRGP